jgi:maltose phosphorylase
MNQDYIKPDNWSIIEEGFDVERVKSSESLFSTVLWDNVLILKKIILAKHSKEVILRNLLSRQDKSRLVENGYPEYFAKVLNAPNWIESILKSTVKNLI